MDPAWCDRCGAELAPAKKAATTPMPVGTVLGEGDAALVLETARLRLGERVVWQARDASGRTLEIVDEPAEDVVFEPEGDVPGWRRPLATLTLQSRRLRVYTPLEGVTLARLLAEAPLPPTRALDVTLSLARAIDALHQAGRLILAVRPTETHVFDERVVFAWDGPFPARDAASPALAPVRGFSAPESFGRGEGRVGPQSDVFVLGATLYYLATGAPIVPELAEPGVELPPPCDYLPGILPGVGGLVRRATERLSSRRTASVARFIEEATRLREKLAAPSTWQRSRHVLAVDGHVGIAKGRDRPESEDSAFARTDARASRTLACVADGVTHSTLGNGRLASQLVARILEERWGRLVESRLFATNEALPERVAANLLESVLRAANEAVVEKANALLLEAAAPDEPEADDLVPPSEVMATTALLAFLDGNHLHLANLGDSRAYLLRDGALERISSDHDVAHEHLRQGRALAEVRAIRGGSQLTRFVGRLATRLEERRYVPIAPEPDLRHLVLAPGDRLVLCSDGVSDYVGATEAEADAAMAAVVTEYRDPARAAFELVVLANRGGGGDNITCIVIDVAPP